MQVVSMGGAYGDHGVRRSGCELDHVQDPDESIRYTGESFTSFSGEIYISGSSRACMGRYTHMFWR